MSILDALTFGTLAEFFDARTLGAGFEYARAGRVGEPELSKLTHDTVIASATVQGTARTPYVVHLYAEYVPHGFWMTTTCSCPVHIDCKHGVALAAALVRHEQSLDPPPEPWRRQLDEVVREVSTRDRQENKEPVPLALEIGIEDSRFAYRREPGPVLVMRPMRLGRRQRWVKTGADWASLAQPTARTDFRTSELDPLLDLLAALQMENSYWRQAIGSPRLSSFGARLVPLLRRAASTGLPLLAGPGLRMVELVEDSVSATGDLTRAEEGRITLRLGVSAASTVTAVVPIGSPAHAVGLLTDDALQLAPLDRPMPQAVQQLLTAADEITVPPEDAEELADYLRLLARVVDLGSSDASVPLPTPVPPVLRLTVTWLSSTEAGTEWSWHYADRSCPLTSADGLAGLRDRTAERAILDLVSAELLAMTRARGGDALTLAIHDLPTLRELDGIEVVEVQRPDFRESDAVPEISFDLVADESSQDTSTDWLDLSVTVSVEGERVPLPDVLAALTTGADFLVLPSGLYLSTDRPELERLRDAVRAAGELREADGNTLSVGHHDLGIWAQLADLGVVDAQAAEWVRRAQALRDLVDLPRPEPTGLATELRPYQLDGFRWLTFLWQHQLGGILADDMGLGKTLQVLALVSHAVAAGEQRPFLVVAPTSVVTAWQTEAAQHVPHLRVRTVARQADDLTALAADADVVVTTYALLRLAEEGCAAVDWAGLVLDEAQQVKNHRSKTYGAVRRIEAPFRLAVTGTPFENRLMELWSLLSIVTPGIYPWPREFSQHVARPVEKAGDEAALRRFRQRIRPFMLRRTKELVARDLPAKQEQVLPVALSPRHRKIYDAHLAKERQRILGLVADFEQNRIAIFAALTKLRQLALDPALVDPDHDAVGSAKIDMLVEHLLEVTAEGHQALVFSQFTSFLTRVEARLDQEGIATTYLDGATRDRGAVIARFRSGSTPVFLISLKAGGVGLTLTEADYVFVLDPWWNPATEAQAVDRAHRIGQTRPVHVYRLISEETIEEKVMELKERKAELFAQVVDGEGASGSGITAEDIRALFEE